MIKKAITALTVAMLSVVVSLSLAGCGASGGSQAPSYENVVGYWEISGGTIGGDEITPDQIDMMKSAGLIISCEFRENSQFEMSEFGSVILSGTWEAPSSGNVKIHGDSGAEVEVVLSDTTHLSMTVDGDVLKFEKVDAENATVTNESTAAAVKDALYGNQTSTSAAASNASASEAASQASESASAASAEASSTASSSASENATQNFEDQ